MEREEEEGEVGEKDGGGGVGGVGKNEDRVGGEIEHEDGAVGARWREAVTRLRVDGGTVGAVDPDEIAEQLGYYLNDAARWRAPDWFIQGVSGGMGPIGVGKGFREMVDFGLIDKMPALGLVQSTGCAPLVEAFQPGQPIPARRAGQPLHSCWAPDGRCSDRPG